MSSTARGPPVPPRELEAQPTVTRLNSTRLGAWRAQPMAQAMAGPLMAEAYPPMVISISTPSCWPRVFRMVPISRLANRPCAMAPSASIR